MLWKYKKCYITQGRDFAIVRSCKKFNLMITLEDIELADDLTVYVKYIRCGKGDEVGNAYIKPSAVESEYTVCVDQDTIPELYIFSSGVESPVITSTVIATGIDCENDDDISLNELNLFLAYHQEDICTFNNQVTVFADADNLYSSFALYSANSYENYAVPGFYKEIGSSTWRYWNGFQFTSFGNCTDER